MWTRNPARAKRYSGAPTAHIPSMQMSTPPRMFWPQALRSPPAEKLQHPRVLQGHRRRNQQETARDYCSTPKQLLPQHERVGIPRLQPWEDVNDMTTNRHEAPEEPDTL